MGYSTRHLEYLSQDYLAQYADRIGEISDLQSVLPDLDHTLFLKVAGVARFWDDSEKSLGSTAENMRDSMVALHGGVRGLVYLLVGSLESVALYIGIPSFDREMMDTAKEAETLRSVLISAFPGIEIQGSGKTKESEFLAAREVLQSIASFEWASIVMGIPTQKIGTQNTGVEQIDRLLRGLYGKRWAYLIVATSEHQEEANKIYNNVLAEMKVVTDSEKMALRMNPLAERYLKLLTAYLDNLQLTKTHGAWTVSAYVLAESSEDLRQASAIVQSVLSGENSFPAPIRTLPAKEAATIAKSIGRVVTPMDAGPGLVKYRFRYSQLLGSRDLAAMMQIPTLEFPGYSVKTYSRFDVYPQTEESGDSIEVGEVFDGTKDMLRAYKVPLANLSKHCLIVGTTGSGKTNTIFHLLLQVWQKGVPFCVIEPAKTEYLELLDTSVGKDLQIFTIGANMAEFRLNPFEILPGTSVQTHIDHLKAVFNSSFAMWGALPIVLERSLYEIYQDRGWDLGTGTNNRGVTDDSFPTLTDLYYKIEQVTVRLGYETDITMDIRAALRARIDSLRMGSKGAMLNVRRSVPFETLLSKPTILELESLGDDEEKALVMGLILMMIYEYYRSTRLSESAGLRHVTVVEEAHRLLTEVPKGQQSEVANTKFQAVETFNNILSEIRAYGEGIIIADQMPGKLASAVVKNTGLKVMHRVVAEDDRESIGASMNLSLSDTKAVVSFQPLEGLAFGEGDDAPIRVRVPYSKIPDWVPQKEMERVQDLSKRFWSSRMDIFAPFACCSSFCKKICSYRKQGEDIVIADATLREQLDKLVLALLDKPSNWEDDYNLLISELRGRLGNIEDAHGVSLCAAIQAIDRYFKLRGSQYGWDYESAAQLRKQFTEIISILLASEPKLINDINNEEFNKTRQEKLPGLIDDFGDSYRKTSRVGQPYRQCPTICKDGTCLYRYRVRELLKNKVLETDLGIASRLSGPDLVRAIADVSLTATSMILPVSKALGEEGRKAGLCYVLHKGLVVYRQNEEAVTELVTQVNGLIERRPAQPGPSQEKVGQERIELTSSEVR